MTICGVNILAAGHLVYIILVNSTNMVVAFSALDRSREATTIFGLRADVYTVLVFDIESNNLTAVDSKNISVLVGSESDESQPTGMLHFFNCIHTYTRVRLRLTFPQIPI